MQVSQYILNRGSRLLDFHLPIYKPPGLCSLKLGEAFKLDIYFVLAHHGIRHRRVVMSSGRYLEPFASGLLTLIVGTKKLERKKNFALTDYVYDMTVEFGVARELTCIDGPVISRVPTSNVNEKRIRNQLAEFQGKILQDRLKSYRTKQDDNRDFLQLMNNPDWEPSGMSYKDILDQIALEPQWVNPEKPRQKYPYVQPKREITVKSLELVRYDKPYGEFKVACDGTFVARQFVSDLAKSLDTQASIVSLNRLSEGPFHQNDLAVLQPYELNLEYYANRIPMYNEIYDAFHEKLDPLWEDMAT